MNEDEAKKSAHSRFQRHTSTLIWKSYLQRSRRWRYLISESVFAFLLYLAAVFIAKPVFLTPLQTEPEPTLTSADLLASMISRNLLGYAPNTSPYNDIMAKVAKLLVLEKEILPAATEKDLNDMLYNRSGGTPLDYPVTWVIFKPKDVNMWRFSIRSTEQAKLTTESDPNSYPNPHLRTGFLAVQLAVSQAIVEIASPTPPTHELSLVSMPVSPLMQETRVRQAISGILFCFTVAMIAPVAETQALAIRETGNRFKRALRMRNVDFSAVYVAWMVYAYMSAIPVCLLGAFTLILIFRWIHIIFALLTLLAYVSVMIMLALIMAMFHSEAWIACLWSVLFTLLQTFLAELLVHHQIDQMYQAVTFVLHVVIPPLGLVHALNEFALLQTGKGEFRVQKQSLFYTILMWGVINLIYFAILMLMQRTMSSRAIGSQVSWKSIIFKKAEDRTKLHKILTPSAAANAKLQEVDELIAKAISFRNVSKSVMDMPALNDITFHIYRGEYTMLYSERVQEKTLNIIEDLILGLTHQDVGTINVLGHTLTPNSYLVTASYMIGYCHRSSCLVDELTVEEHIKLFGKICLWNEQQQYVSEYMYLRMNRLMAECDLAEVWHDYVRDLGLYYRAQLCWAIALLLEPRIIFIPNFLEQPAFFRVIRDKIMRYKKFLTIVKMSFISIQLEYADRVFIFDNKILVFGGTPAYIFFKYGRDYRVRMILRHRSITDDDNLPELIERAKAAGASVRAHLGSLLILRLPPFPTANVAALMKDLEVDAVKYGITSLSISLADSEEVCRRAIYASRAVKQETSIFQHNVTKEALKRINKPTSWKRKNSACLTCAHMKVIGRKYLSFYFDHKFLIILTFFSALFAGIFIGLSISSIVAYLDGDEGVSKDLFKQILTVESLEQTTILVIRSDFTKDATSIGSAYVMSETKAKPQEIKDMVYTALSYTESLTEYLVTRAIDSPQQYVYMYAYGLDVSHHKKGNLTVQALYSPIHQDYGAAARSLARVYMALLRHYTQVPDASIQVTDDPLVLDLTPRMKYVSTPPLLIQFLLILTISHITLLPSMEYGIIRHNQCQAMDFSPARYWFSLFFFDLLFYLLLVVYMTVAGASILYYVVPSVYFSYFDLVVIPVTLLIYGICCIPQAYLFSLGPMPALNTMSFIIVNIVFGENTLMAKLFNEDTLPYALYFMRLSPQFNMAYAYVKIKQILLYNSECVMHEAKNLCTLNTIHKCCERCGVLQKCFKRKYYFIAWESGILKEVLSMLGTAVVFLVVLMLWEYRIIHRFYRKVASLFVSIEALEDQPGIIVADRNERPVVDVGGAAREKADVLEKLEQINAKRSEKVVTFGEHLLSVNVSKKSNGMFILQNIHLGVSKGEVLALSGLKKHGRMMLCEVLAGFKIPSKGDVWSMSKYRLRNQPQSYSRNVALSCDLEPLPQWMSVFEALKLIAVLRGIPINHVDQEIQNYIKALDLHNQAEERIGDLLPNERARLHFAAAVIGAPPVLVLDECTAYQKYSVRRAMYYILYVLKQKGHGIFISSSNVESHMPITNRLAIFLDGYIYDIDHVDALIERYSNRGCTVVVHLKDEIEVKDIFAKYFKSFVINDITEVLVNIQVYDTDLSWAEIFDKMEKLQAKTPQVYSYIISAIPIDYIYNSIINNEKGLTPTKDLISLFCLKRMFTKKPTKRPRKGVTNKLKPFENKYDITKLNDLPWSVIFQR